MLDWGRRIETLEEIVKGLATSRAVEIVNEQISDVHDGISRSMETLLKRIQNTEARVKTMSSEIRDQGLVLTEHVNNQRPEDKDVDDPVRCPSDHTGCLRVSVLEEVSQADPSHSTIVGGAFYCPLCGESFYYLRGKGRFKAPKPAEEQAAGKAPPPPPQVKFRGGRER